MRLKKILLLLLVSFHLLAQESASGLDISCSASEEFLFKKNAKRIKTNNISSSKFNGVFFDVPPNIESEIKEAFKIWESILISNIPINTHIYWENLGNSTLANAASSKVYKNFSNAPNRDIWYPSSLAESIHGKNLNGNEADIVLKINKNMVWSVQNPDHPEAYDLVSVILHEIAHGIGFLSSFEKKEDEKIYWGIQNLPFIYDSFLVDSKDQSVTNHRFYTNGSESLTELLTQLEVYFNINKEIYPYQNPKVHTPNPFSVGGSLSHFSNRMNSFPDSRDELMYPTIMKRLSFDSPGEATLGVLYQMGWELNGYPARRVQNTDLVLYPNPSSDFIQLKTNLTGALSYKIFDNKGKLVASQTLLEATNLISISELRPGVYYFKTDSASIPFIKI